MASSRPGSGVRGGSSVTEHKTPPQADEEAARLVEEALEKAERLRKARQFQEGIDLLIDALQHKVHMDKVYYRLGNLFFDAGDLARAEYAYQRAIETNPGHVNAHHNLAVVYRKTGRIHDSVRMRKRATRLEAGGWWSRALLGSGPPQFAKPARNGMGGASITPEEVFAPRLQSPPAGAAAPDLPEAFGTQEDADPMRDDPEGFRRFGRRVALAGLLVFLGIAILFLGLVYLIGYWLF